MRSAPQATPYDSENRLIAGPGTTLAYDPAGRLYQITSGGTTRRFVYDGDRLIGEVDGTGTVRNLYVQGPRVNEPLLWYDPSAGTSGSFHADERGSIVALTDSAGDLVGTRNRYDENGAPQGGVLTSRFGYTGQAWLPELGLYYYKARVYHPTLGRFMQTDPVGYGGEANLYAYVADDPVNGSDPAGLYTDDYDSCGSRINGANRCSGMSGVEFEEMRASISPAGLRGPVRYAPFDMIGGGAGADYQRAGAAV